MAEGQVLFVRKDSCNVDTKSDENGGSSTAEDDAWDDTALVQAYDRAVSLAKQEVIRRMAIGKDSVSGNESNTSNKPRRKSRRNKKQWHVGDPCRAVYSQDGVCYEATVHRVLQDRGICVITYVGYNNEEEIPLKSLKPSQGPTARKTQELAAAQEIQQQPVENSLEMELSDRDSVKGAGYFRPRPSSSQENRMDWESHSARPLPKFKFMPPNFRSVHTSPMAMPTMVVPPPPPPPIPPNLTNSFPEEDEETLSAMLMSWYMSGFHTGYYHGLKQAKNFASNGDRGSRNSSRKK